MAALLIGAAMAGCGDKVVAPVIPPLPFVFADLKTPQHTLLNIKQAWERRDSIRIQQIYAPDYIGTSTDLSDNSSLVFTRDMEVGIVNDLKRDSAVTNVQVTFPAETAWIRTSYESDPPGWASIQLPSGVVIQVHHAVGYVEAKNATFMEFKFRPVSVSGSDTTWAIVRWTEIGRSSPHLRLSNPPSLTASRTRS